MKSLRDKGVPEQEIDSLSTALSYLTYMRMQVGACRFYFHLSVCPSFLSRTFGSDPLLLILHGGGPIIRCGKYPWRHPSAWKTIHDLGYKENGPECRTV